MAETLVENKICNACGAEVRPNALFCYNCGGSVAPEVVVALKDNKNIRDDKSFEESAEKKDNGKPAINEQPTITKSVEKPVLQPSANQNPKLKSAAAMRRKSKIYQPKKTQIIWEEHENAPNGWFIVVTIGLTLLTAVILYLAVYLKW